MEKNYEYNFCEKHQGVKTYISSKHHVKFIGCSLAIGSFASTVGRLLDWRKKHMSKITHFWFGKERLRDG
jgi:hypothetical protein